MPLTQLYATVLTGQDRHCVADFLSRGAVEILVWCDQWSIKLNPSRFQNLVVNCSRAVFPSHSEVSVSDVVIPDCLILKVLYSYNSIARNCFQSFILPFFE